MMKAIRFGDVRLGDVVCVKANEPLEIEKILHFSVKTGMLIKGHPFVMRVEDKHDAVIGLLHRPDPEGRTERDLLKQVGMCALHVAPGKGQTSSPEVMRENIVKLREAIEAWELGKP